MIKYVKVKFDKYGKNYIYKIPERINAGDIQNYIVVENVYYKKEEDISPYEIVKVISVIDEKFIDEKKYSKVSYIVDTIDGSGYEFDRNNLKTIVENKKKMENFFSELTYDEQIGFLLNNISDEDLMDILEQ